MENVLNLYCWLFSAVIVTVIEHTSLCNNMHSTILEASKLSNCDIFARSYLTLTCIIVVVLFPYIFIPTCSTQFVIKPCTNSVQTCTNRVKLVRLACARWRTFKRYDLLFLSKSIITYLRYFRYCEVQKHRSFYQSTTTVLCATASLPCDPTNVWDVGTWVIHI